MSSSSADSSPKPSRDRALVYAWGMAMLACLIGLAVTRPPFRNDVLTIYFGEHAEYLPFVPWLLLLAYLGQRPVIWQPVRELALRVRHWASATPVADGLTLLVVAGVAWWATTSVANKFEVVTPTYHDEFSYLFQAKTFLRGELSAPGFPQKPELFDQVHVLSGERMASRYFPGTGLWMLPFVAGGNPWLGHHIAHVLCALCVYWAGRELGSRLVATVAALLFALSPGLMIFSNLLLAHHPTLAGLTLFLAAYLRWMRTPSWQWVAVAGSGLSFAMLCRPMTAAGFALPFGVHFAWHLLASECSWKTRSVDFTAMVAPLIVGFVVLGVTNVATTGSLLTTPYQQYTDVHTPRHVYGFHNGQRGDAVIAADGYDRRRRMNAYDDWAEDLDAAMAVRHLGTRAEASTRLTLGVVPLVFVGVYWLMQCRRRARREWLLAASIGTLFLVHVPYWFSGIMNWHYVMESSVMWVLLTGLVTRDVFRAAVAENTDGLAGAWVGMLATAVIVNVTTVMPLYVAEVDGRAAEVDFARTIYASFFQSIEQMTAGREAIILVQPDESTPQMDYVVNEPGLSARVLYGRLHAGDDVRDIASLFLTRDVYVFDVAGRDLQLVQRGAQ